MTLGRRTSETALCARCSNVLAMRDLPPPKPLEPPPATQPRTLWLPLLLVLMTGFFALAVAAFVVVLMLGYAGPILVLALLAFLFFGGFGLQYLIWGRLFERIYRDAWTDADDDRR